MTRLAVLTLALLVSTAHADPKADATFAFASFIDAVATNKPAPVELFIVPGDDAGGKSAWVAGELAGKIERGGKTKNEPIRVSAFLAKTDKGWRVVATHWSTGEPDAKAEYCGMLDAWKPVASIPKDAAPLVKQVFDALDPVDFKAGEGPVYDTSKFGKTLSDDKNAYAIGSAPKETFAGAKIKAVFKKWKIQPETDEPGKYPARAALGPDGEMAWLVFGMRGPEELCVSYRTFMVLAKEASGWKVVHQHYSRPHH